MAEINLEDYLKNVGTIANYGNIEKLTERAAKIESGKLEGKLSEPLSGISKIIGDEQETMLAAPRALREKQVGIYKMKNAKAATDAANMYGDQIVSDYAGSINNIVKEIVSEIEAELKKAHGENFERIPQQQKDAVIASALYAELAKALKQLGFFDSLKLNKDYKDDKELIEAAKAFEAYEKAPEDKRNDLGKNSYVNGRGMHPLFRQYVDGNAAYEQQKEMYARTIVKKLVAKGDNGFKIDEKKMKDAFGTLETYANIAPIVYKMRTEGGK